LHPWAAAGVSAECEAKQWPADTTVATLASHHFALRGQEQNFGSKLDGAFAGTRCDPSQLDVTFGSFVTKLHDCVPLDVLLLVPFTALYCASLHCTVQYVCDTPDKLSAVAAPWAPDASTEVVVVFNDMPLFLRSPTIVCN
jgi:hypothetical protein